MQAGKALGIDFLDPPRETVTVSGKDFPVDTFGDYPLSQARRISETWDRVIQLETKPSAEVSEDDDVEYDSILDTVIDWAIPKAPEKIRRNATRGEKRGAGEAFFGHLIRSSNGGLLMTEKFILAAGRAMALTFMRTVGNGASRDSSEPSEETLEVGTT